MRALMLSLLLLAPPCFAGTPLPDAPHVVTQGEGQASATPDRARVTLSAPKLGNTIPVGHGRSPTLLPRQQQFWRAGRAPLPSVGRRTFFIRP